MKYYAGVDIGGTNIKVVILNEAASILTRQTISTPHHEPPLATFEAIKSCISSMFRDKSISLKNLAGMGIGIPGLVDRDANYVYNAPNLGWYNVSLYPLIHDFFDFPVKIDNDGNVCAVGESVWGVAKGCKDIVLVTLGTGVGGGCIINGEPLMGAGNIATEVGHMVIHIDGEQCPCGMRGCFDAYCSATALEREARKRAFDNPKTKLMEYSKGDPHRITPEMIGRGYDEGDKASVEILSEFSKNLGIGLLNLINILNPEIVVLSGGVAQLGERILPGVREIVDNSLVHPAQQCRIVVGTLGSDAGVLGAGMLMLSLGKKEHV